MSNVKTVNKYESKIKLADQLVSESYDMNDVIGQAFWLLADQLVGYRKQNRQPLSKRDRKLVESCGNSDIIGQDWQELDLGQTDSDVMYIIRHARTINDTYHNKYSRAFLKAARKLINNSSDEDNSKVNGHLNYTKEHFEGVKEALGDLDLPHSNLMDYYADLDI